MKSQVGLGRLHPDGSLGHAQDTLKEQPGEPSQVAANRQPSELLSVLMHVEKAAIDELLQKSSRAED